jgi:ubiquinone/menaquinone biosynthesis C-methylase UbiE
VFPVIQNLLHSLKVEPTRDESARQEFISCLRGYILVDMATTMNRRYENIVAPRFEREHNRLPDDGPEVHKAMKSDLYFKFYSSVRYSAQEMVWRSVIPVIERNLDGLIGQAKALKDDAGKGSGSVRLDSEIQIPRNVSAIDVHLAPGSYHTEYAPDDVAAGAIYDNGLNIFASNMMGSNLDDIGESMSNYVRLKFPDFHPGKILDCGCTIGHNSAAWARTFPDATVHAIDVSAPLLRYGNARAQSQGVAVQFEQMDATALQFEDESFDVVFTSMFLHELPLKDIHAFMAEAYRVLKPGGLLLNMELPPNDQMKAYDSFYLDWDSYYNQEPFYKCFRDQNYKELCTRAGFDPDKCVQFVMPQFGYMDEADFKSTIGASVDIDDKVGRLTAGINWFGFGAWKEEI